MRFLINALSPVVAAGLREAGVSRFLFGLTRTDIQIKFFFDDEHKLTGYTVEKVVTSF